MFKPWVICSAVLLGSLAPLVLALNENAAPPHKVSPAAPSHKSPADAAAEATDPSAVLSQLGFYYWNGSEGGPGVDADEVPRQSTDTFLFQPVLPLTKRNVLRPALPIIRTNGTELNETGNGDLFLLDVWLYQVKGGTWGIGPVASLPIASEDAFGTGRYQAGPVAMYMYKAVPKNIFGIMGYNQFSFAGDEDRENVNLFSFQPIWVMHFKWGYMGWTDQVATINWQEDNSISFPVGFRFGKVFKGQGATLMNLAVQPYYFFNERAADVFGFKVSATFIKPKWLNH
jgi:hypothetical protein